MQQGSGSRLRFMSRPPRRRSASRPCRWPAAAARPFRRPSAHPRQQARRCGGRSRRDRPRSSHG
ncbi:MAG: hypothetical protein EBR82_54450 [Caulobacteraceae bacterium]|nr:hypothetical protein [Caulobacteraceae bacterium]